jgi:drug/metabolite transporter (DMT)-like permease
MALSPALLALLSAACFGGALIVVHFGLAHVPTHGAARISLGTTALIMWLLAPFLLDVTAWHAGAAAVFALVGLFYPAAVTVITYESNRLLGPTLTGSISSCSPLFATAFAVMILGEQLTARGIGGCVVIVGALVIMSWQRQARTPLGWRLLLPLSGAAVRALAQTLGKLGLNLWPSPFAATLIGYTVSGAAIWALPRTREPHSGVRAKAIAWFAAAGALNGSALLLFYHALESGSVSVIAPLVALYPLFTILFSRVFIRSEVLTRRTVGGALLAVAGVALLVSG